MKHPARDAPGIALDAGEQALRRRIREIRLAGWMDCYSMF
jgi:hypothetical protein